MGKVSIGLRGWRFEETEVFDESGNYRPLEEMPDDVANRISRLQALVGEPCDACVLERDGKDIESCNVADVVYGEPMGEVLLCTTHEADFNYWFLEEGGDSFAGDRLLRDAFQEWFAKGGRAPEGFDGTDHVETSPESIPDPALVPPNERGQSCEVVIGDVDLDKEYP